MVIALILGDPERRPGRKYHQSFANTSDAQRTTGERPANDRRTLGRRSRSARIAAVISGDTEACRSCASASMAALTAFFAASEACVSGAVLRACVSIAV